MTTTIYNTPGHVCPNTGRLAMTIAEGYKRTDSADRDFFTFNAEAAASGLDPWRMLDGIDASTDLGADGMPLRYELDFASGGSIEVYPSAVIYMQRTKEERAAETPLYAWNQVNHIVGHYTITERHISLIEELEKTEFYRMHQPEPGVYPVWLRTSGLSGYALRVEMIPTKIVAARMTANYHRGALFPDMIGQREVGRASFRTLSLAFAFSLKDFQAHPEIIPITK